MAATPMDEQGAGERLPGVTRVDRIVVTAAVVWTVVVVGLTFALKGWDDDSVTRAAVLAVLTVDGGIAALTWRTWTGDAPGSATGFSARTRWSRWVLPCVWRAAIVELCYMPSRPLYDSLRWMPDDDIMVRVAGAAIDVTLTAPFYVVLFSGLWLMLRRWRLPVWYAVLVLPFSQALGDGNAFFLANPAMLLMAPYVVLNAVACQLVPYLRVRRALPVTPSARPWHLALPLVLVPAVYWCGGAVLIMVGRATGLRD